jgi:hypothetical protein
MPMKYILLLLLLLVLLLPLALTNALLLMPVGLAVTDFRGLEPLLRRCSAAD